MKVPLPIPNRQRLFACKDNRALCKCLCPITVLLKLMSYFSLLRVQRYGPQKHCIDCFSALFGRAFCLMPAPFLRGHAVLFAEQIVKVRPIREF